MSDTIHEIRKGGNLFFLINAFLGAYNRRTDVLAAQTGGLDSKKLDAIIEKLDPISELLPMSSRLETIHGLISDLASADPDKIKELAASVKAARKKLQTSLDNQQKGD